MEKTSLCDICFRYKNRIHNFIWNGCADCRFGRLEIIGRHVCLKPWFFLKGSFCEDCIHEISCKLWEITGEINNGKIWEKI